MKELILTVGDYWLYNEKLVKIITASSEAAEVEFVISGRREIVETCVLDTINLTDDILTALGFSPDTTFITEKGSIRFQRYRGHYLWIEVGVDVYTLNELVWISRITMTNIKLDRLKEIFNEN